MADASQCALRTHDAFEVAEQLGSMASAASWESVASNWEQLGLLSMASIASVAAGECGDVPLEHEDVLMRLRSHGSVTLHFDQEGQQISPGSDTITFVTQAAGLPVQLFSSPRRLGSYTVVLHPAEHGQQLQQPQQQPQEDPQQEPQQQQPEQQPQPGQLGQYSVYFLP